MTVGDRIRKERKAAGMTQKQLGEKSGIAEPTIRRYELGKLYPKIATLQKIADALDSDVNYLLHGATLADREEAFLNRIGHEGETDPVKIHESRTKQRQYEALDRAFNELNEIGRSKAVERVQELTEIPKYRADVPEQPVEDASSAK